MVTAVNLLELSACKLYGCQRSFSPFVGLYDRPDRFSCFNAATSLLLLFFAGNKQK